MKCTCRIENALVGPWIQKCPLCKSAPVMYRALKNLLEYLDHHEWGTVPSGGITDIEAREAIAEAEKRS